MKKILMICIFLILPLVANAAENPIWVDADGGSYQGEMDTLKEVRDRARRDTQNKAVEQAVGTGSWNIH